jgi:UDP-N-acetylglucosamine:LPS N-acetylglucosamine transferase
MGEPPEVLLFVVDAGGGHRAAARALAAAAAERRLPWRFETVNVTDVLAPRDFTRRLTGRSLEDTYNAMVRRGWTRFLVPLLRGYQWTIGRLRPALVRTMAGYLRGRSPALVVSLFPNLNGVLADAVHQALPGVPFWVVLTDPADYPPHFWMEPEVDRVLVATEHAEAQARALGLPARRVVRTSGMVMHPRFYTAEREAARARVRLEMRIPPEAFTVMLLFGGKGSAEIEPLSEALLQGTERHVIAVCGDNPRLHRCLLGLQERHPDRLHALAFTDRVPELLCASDVLVSKPGPGTLAEAFHCRIPLVVTSNAHTIPQERYNARFLEERGVGLVVGHWKEMPGAVARLAGDDSERARLLANLAALPENRAVYEVLDLIGSALAETAGPSLKQASGG